uniref:Sushi domain-containing protein n=1 Tax=Panagrolaimus sp. PS1159 TaxID=55785 RepID=A0AC35FB83_9BILA
MFPSVTTTASPTTTTTVITTTTTACPPNTCGPIPVVGGVIVTGPAPDANCDYRSSLTCPNPIDLLDFEYAPGMFENQPQGEGVLCTAGTLSYDGVFGSAIISVACV